MSIRNGLGARSLLSAIVLVCAGAAPVGAFTLNGPSITPGSQPITMHGGPVLQPTIACLMWSPSGSAGFSATDVSTMNQYLTGVQQYLSNQNTSGGFGVEPPVRQYGVWGAYFPNGCVVDNGHLPKNPIPWNNAGPTIQAEITAAQAAPLNLAPWSPETVILVFTKGIAYDSNYGTSTTGCAFHNFFGSNHNYYGTGQNYGLIPYPSNTFCKNGNALNEFQTLASHELFEAATDPVGTSWFLTGNQHNGEVGDGCPGALLSFPSGGSGYVSQAVDDFSGACQSFVPEETLGAAAVTTGTNTINVIVSSAQNTYTHLTGDGTNWNFGSTFTWAGNSPEVPAVVSPDGTAIDVYVRGTDGALYNQHFDGTSWWGWWYLGAYIIGPPAVAYRVATGLEYVFALMPDGSIAGATIDPVSWAVTNFSVPLPAGVLATTPPQAFSVSNTNANSCFYVFVNGSDNAEYLQEFCSDPTFLSFSRIQTGIAPTLVSSFETSTNIVDMIVNPLLGNREGVWGGSVPELYYFNNWVLTWTQYSQMFEGPLSAVSLGSGAVAVGRQLGLPTAQLPLIASTSPNKVTWNQWTQVVAGASGSPYVFSPDGQNADVFYNVSGDLHHIRYNGSSWLSAQDLGLQVQ